MELSINKPKDISLEMLQCKKQEGFSVQRSAHIGNHRMYNLILANAGVEMLLVDHNLTTRDTNYNPEKIIQNGISTELTDQEFTLSLRTRSNNDTLFKGQFLDEIHSQSLSEAFPNTPITTNTDYLRENETIVAEIIEICSEVMPELFNRQALPDGRVQRLKAPLREVSPSNFLQLRDDPRSEETAIMIPNEVDIICNFVIEALNYGRDRLYHVSGPDMISYINGILPNLQILYSQLTQASFASKLPETLNIELVAGTAFKVGCTVTNRPNLEPFAIIFADFNNFEIESSNTKRRFFKGKNPTDQEKAEFLDILRFNRESLIIALRKQFQELQGMLDQDGSTYTSQYDVIADNGLYVPDNLSSITTANLGQIMKIASGENP